MIRAMKKLDGGRRLIVLGVDDENVRRLTSNDPIMVDGASVGMPDVRILIVHGRTLKDAGKALEEIGFEMPEIPDGQPPRAPVVDLCGQELCTDDAAFSYVWPGRPRALLCAKHVHKLKEIAEALGLPVASLDVQPANVARQEGRS